jgi:predicted transcriptional regulator
MACERPCRGWCACDRLRSLGVDVVEAPTPPGELAYFDPDARRVVLRPGLPRAVRRATLAHEVAHVEVQDSTERTWWSEVDARHVEDCADEIAARQLLPLGELVDVLAAAATVDAVAAELDVDAATVRCRIATLTHAERRYVDRRMMPLQQRLA